MWTTRWTVLARRACTCRRACRPQKSQAAEHKYRQTAYKGRCPSRTGKSRVPELSPHRDFRAPLSTPFTRRAPIHPGETDPSGDRSTQSVPDEPLTPQTTDPVNQSALSIRHRRQRSQTPPIHRPDPLPTQSPSEADPPIHRSPPFAPKPDPGQQAPHDRPHTHSRRDGSSQAFRRRFRRSTAR